MSSKRKTDGKETPGVIKKPKIDFFAPKTAVAKTASSFDFSSKDTSATRLTAWNVNGIHSILKDEQKRKTLIKYLDAEDPDILILTETKFAQGKPDLQYLKTKFKYQYWGTDLRAGQAGTAILSKIKPLAIVETGLPTWTPSASETKGRYVELEFEHLFVVGTYVPNSGENFKSMDIKQKWNVAFKNHLRDLDSRKPVIWGGDLNCILQQNDLDNKALPYWDRMSGLSKTEREEFNNILNPTDDESRTFVDVWRHLHPDTAEYTHSSERFGSWRLDSFILSERIVGKASCCLIRHELKDLKLSDHWPVTLDFTGLL